MKENGRIFLEFMEIEEDSAEKVFKVWGGEQFKYFVYFGKDVCIFEETHLSPA